MKIINATAYNTKDLKAFCIACEKLASKGLRAGTIKEILFIPRDDVEEYDKQFSCYGTWGEDMVEIRLLRPSKIKLNALVALAQAADGDELSLPGDQVVNLAETILRAFGGSVYTRNYSYPRKLRKSKQYKKLFATQLHYTHRAPNGVGKAGKLIKAKVAIETLREEAEQIDWSVSDAKCEIKESEAETRQSKKMLKRFLKEKAEALKALKAHKAVASQLVKEWKKK